MPGRVASCSGDNRSAAAVPAQIQSFSPLPFRFSRPVILGRREDFLRDSCAAGVSKVMNDAAEKPRNNQRTEYMKTSLLLAIAAVAVLAAVNTVSADEALLSPRAKANQPSRISRSGIDPDLVRGQNDPGVAAQAKA